MSWICGRSEFGETCADGPDTKGTCRAGYACHPTKKGDRWFCDRPLDQGGACHDGPTEIGKCSIHVSPCQPKRSPESKSKFLTRAIILLGIGLFLFIIGAEIWSKQLIPGNLSSAHSGNIDCGSCHHNYRFSPIKSLHLLLTNNLISENSESCLSCHHLGEHPFNAHNQSSEKIKQLRQEKTQKPPSKHLFRDLSHLVLGDDITERKLNCSACHKEHHGNQPMLLKMNQQLCQSCHIQTFTGFEDHPEFKNYPHKERTHIIFDHISHISKHFNDEKYKQVAPKQCADCHQLSPQGKMMLLKPYEVTCASCHDKEIIGRTRAGEKGILFINVPGLDVKTLKSKNINIGDWPVDAEGELSPFMITMLAENSEFIPIYHQIKDLDLEDLSEASEEQLQSVAKLARLIKSFLHKLSSSGTAEIYKHIGAISSTDITFGQNIPETMPEDSIDALISEFKAIDTVAEKSIEPDDWQSHGGWYREGTNLYYLPRKHADLFLTSWLTITGELKQEVKSLLNNKLFWLLADPDAPGTCANCHSIQQTGKAQFKIQWRMRQPATQPFKQKFTKFSHKDHLSIMDKSACVSCHQFDKTSSYLESFKHQDPHKFVSNFKPIRKSTCSECHSAENNNNSCLTCHEYHVGKFNLRAPATELKLP